MKNNTRSSVQVQPKDKPTSYWMDHRRQVLEYIREKLHQNPQEEREAQEFSEDKLEENPDKE